MLHLYWIAIFLSLNKHCIALKEQLRGETVSVSYYGFEPFIIQNRINPENGPRGSDPDIARILAHKMGFNMTFRREPNWISKAPNGTWLGKIGSVINGVSEFGIGNHALIYNYYKLVDYTPMLYPIDLFLRVPKPKLLPAFLNIYRPFEGITWIWIWIAFITVSVVNIIFVIKAPKQNNPDQNVKFIYPYIFVPWSILLGQNIIFSKNISSSFTLNILIWIISSYFLVLSFESNLRAYLVTPKYEKPVDSAQDLLDRKWNVHINNATRMIHILKSSPNKALNILADQVLKENLFYRPDASGSSLPLELEKSIATNGGATLISKYSALSEFARVEERHGYLPVRVSKESVYPGYSGFLIPKGAKWAPEMGKHIQHLVDAGIVNHLIESYIPPKYLKPSKNEQVPPSSYDLEHIFDAIVILLGGLFISLIVFVGENIVNFN